VRSGVVMACVGMIHTLVDYSIELRRLGHFVGEGGTVVVLKKKEKIDSEG